jgi:hypothetical protein
LPEPLLAILKLCALALVYLFFLRVLRAVWAEMSPARAAGAAPAPPKPRPARRATRVRARGGTGLVVIEPAELEGTRHDLGDEVTVGRAAGCTVTLDDHYVSQVHARFSRRDGDVFVEDLGSTNGTYVNGEKLTGSALVKRGDQVRIGSTVLEVHP